MDDLALVADAYRRNLPEGRSWSFAYGGLDRLGVPVVAAGLAFPDGYHLRRLRLRGLTPEEALVGALGELSEDTHSRGRPRLECPIASRGATASSSGDSWGRRRLRPPDARTARRLRLILRTGP